MNPNEQMSLAASAYEAYGDMVDHKNKDGQPMPLFEALPLMIKAAWAAAAVYTFRKGAKWAATYQTRINTWLQSCFPQTVCTDKLERGDRFLEEALELLQSNDYPKERIAALTEYVYNRPPGEPAQEVGGTMVTLAAYCFTMGIDVQDAAETELARISEPEVMAKIQAKQASKPTGSALPQ